MILSIKDISMKYSLGKIVLSIFMLCIVLQAEDFTYTMHTNTKTPYLKESVLLDIDINQTNPNVVLFFQFHILKSDAYSIEQLSSKQDHTLHQTKIHYRYLIYPLKTGEVHVSFSLIKRETNDASVAYSFSGDRDDFKKLETIDTPIFISPLILQVKPLAKHTQLIGDFNLTYHLKKIEAAAYEPIPMQIIIKGMGYVPMIEHILPKEENITYFTHPPEIKKTIHSDGIQYTAIYTMAFSSAKSFTLPAINLQAFSPSMHKPYVLHIPSNHFTVKSPPNTQLVDTVDMPKPLSYDFSWIKTFFIYLIVFISGYFTAIAIQQKKVFSTKKTIPHPLKEKIQKSPDAKRLLQLLMAQNNPHFSTNISYLENSLYTDAKINLNKVKKEAMEKLDEP